jgi:hypothetical protein
MEHEHGAFKVNPATRPLAMDEMGGEPGVWVQSGISPMLHCKASAAVKLDKLPYLLMK